LLQIKDDPMPNTSWDAVKRIADDAEHVVKFVFSKADAVAEAVLYRYPTYATRTVICCSVMSGCPIGCRFCGSGDYFVRNLTAEEIVAQVEHCLGEIDCRPEEIGKFQIMFMSMGEPMLNLKALSEAIQKLHSAYPNAALLISTSGPKVNYDPLYTLAQAIPQVGLQFSIHEATDEARDRLIPFPSKLSLREIASVGVAFYRATERSPFFNYCAHDGNSSDKDADGLWRLFRSDIWKATVSVVCERDEGLPKTSDYQRNLATGFAEKLVSRGFDVRVFDPAGQDTIGGGCGQLWYVQDWMQSHPELARPTCGNGQAVIHAPVGNADGE
jgi:23S rRNA (adenine2503-C2)-methyltransferase